MLIAVEHILGVQARVDGIRMAPNLPASWTQVAVERVLGDCRYRVSIQADLPSGSPLEISVDGKAIAGNVVPYVSDSRVRDCAIVVRVARQGDVP